MPKNIPKLRFPEFRDEWEEKILGNLLIIDRGASPRPIQRYISKSDEGIPWIKIGDVPEGSKYITKTKERINSDGAKVSRKVNIGDFILSNSMSFGRPYILKIDGCIHDGWLALKNIDKTELSGDFLYVVLSSTKTRKKFLSLAAGSAVKNLKSETVKTTKIYTPKLKEQQKIAEFLTSVDNWIEKLKKQKEKQEQYKKAMMQKIYSQEIRFKDENGKAFPNWEEKKLSNMLSMVIDNRGKTPPVESTGIPLLEVNVLGNKSINYSKVTKFVSENTYKNWFRKYLHKNDILFSTVGATALCSIFTDNTVASVAQNIVGLRFENENPNFMFYLLTEKRNNHKFKRIQMGAVQPSVKVSQMVKISFSIPNINEQQKIAAFLTSVDKVIESKEQQISLAEAYKKGLMQRMFI